MPSSFNRRRRQPLAPSAIDQRTLYEDNSLLRGRQTPRIEQPGRSADELQTPEAMAGQAYAAAKANRREATVSL